MGLKVIGSGLGRTGTLSTKLALEQLGFAPCHHMVEVFMNPAQVQLWIDAGNGKPDWDAMMRDTDGPPLIAVVEGRPVMFGSMPLPENSLPT